MPKQDTQNDTKFMYAQTFARVRTIGVSRSRWKQIQLFETRPQAFTVSFKPIYLYCAAGHEHGWERKKERDKEWKGMMAEGAMRVEVGPRGPLTRARRPLSLSWCSKTHARNTRWLFSIRPFLLWNFRHSRYTPLSPPRLSLSLYLSIRLPFSRRAKRFNHTHVRCSHMRFSRLTMQCGRNDG